MPEENETDQWSFTKIAEKARQIATLIAALGVISTGFLFVADHPYITNKIKEMAGTSHLSGEIVVFRDEMVERLNSIEIASGQSSDPAIRFTVDGNTISNGNIGDLVIVTIRYTQLRDCGRPFIVMGFKNGKELIHIFEDVSIIDAAGLGFASPANPQEVYERKFVARIPANEGVQQGSAIGWIEIGPYTNCPNIPTSFSPRMPFSIMPSEEILPKSREIEL